MGGSGEDEKKKDGGRENITSVRKGRMEGKQEEANERENALALAEEGEEEGAARRGDDRWERGVRETRRRGQAPPPGVGAEDERPGRRRRK